MHQEGAQAGCAGERGSSNARCAALLGALGEAVIAAAFDGTIVYANAAAEAQYGYGEGAMIGAPLRTLECDDALPPTPELTGGPWSGELRARRRDGSTFLAHATDRAFAWSPGEREGVVRVSRDVTRERQEQARRMTADRMASVGTLAAGAAHELNNPLAYVTSNLRFLSDELTELGDAAPGSELAARVTEMKRSLEDAVDGAERMRVIVRDLKLLCRADEGGRRPIDLSTVADTAIRVTASGICARASLVRRFEAAPRVMGNEALFAQILVNLLHNAAQAISDRGPDGRIEVAIRAGEDGSAVLEVTDSGCGIPEPFQRRVFDPFFTTRTIGAGTGLGLSVVHALVTQLGGTIDLESAPGRGTTFRLHFPPTPAGPVLGHFVPAAD